MLQKIKQKFTLQQQDRLKGTKLIQQLFEDGNSFYVFPFKILYKNAFFKNSFLKGGFGVSKKYFKKATDRNRIKRLMREGFRLQKNGLKNVLQANNGHLSVFFIYVGNALPTYADVMGKISVALKRLEKVANEKDDTGS